MNGMLASVCSVDEARIALHACADLIDCKDPRSGALGALPPATVSRIVAAVGADRPVSATTGDLVHGTRRLRDAAATVGDCGVDYVKAGLFDIETALAQIKALSVLNDRHHLIAVCFADRYDPIRLLPYLADNGFCGVMLDTVDKRAGRLTTLWSRQRLAAFVAAGQRHGLLCGLAGRLTLADVPQLLPLQADYLGFRSALCGDGDRCATLDRAATMRIRDAVPFDQKISAVRVSALALH